MKNNEIKENLRISVIIPTRNRVNSLKRTIKTLIESKRLVDEIIVIDQSDDEIMQSVMAISEEYNSQTETIVKCCHLDIPSSTKARNKGIHEVNGDIVIFSDDDVDYFKDTTQQMYDAFMDSKVALVAAVDINMHEKESIMNYIGGTRSFVHRKKGHVTKSVLGRYPANTSESTDTDWAMGYCFAVRRELITDYNIWFDEKLQSYAYAEDLDFSYRFCKVAKKNGYKCIISNKVKVSHLGSLEYRIPSKLSTYMYVGNRYYLGNKLNITGYKFYWAWTNNMMVLFKYIKKQNRKDLIEAIAFTKKNKLKIIKGDLEYLGI